MRYCVENNREINRIIKINRDLQMYSQNIKINQNKQKYSIIVTLFQDQMCDYLFLT